MRTHMNKPIYAFITTLLTMLICTHSIAQPLTHKRLITTNGIGEVKAVPDQATIAFFATAIHATSKEAKEDVDLQVNKLLVKLYKLGINKTDIIASSIQLNPRFEHHQNTGPKFTGYEARRNINITLKHLNKLTQVMDLALDSGINSIQQIRYQSSQEQQLQEQARQKAIDDSLAKAKLLAKAYGAELGPIRSINYHNSTPLPGMAFLANAPQMAMSRFAAPTPATYLPDEIIFTDSIQVSFDLIIND